MQTPLRARERRLGRRRTTAGPAALVLLLGLLAPGGAAGQSVEQLQPKGHFKIERPRLLNAAEALVLYDNIREQMHAIYAYAKLPAIARFSEWRRYNTAPYVSATHGQRYVNNYANRTARAYGRYEDSGPMPEGSVLVKDSFTVTQDGDVFASALFVMEKMAPGFNAVSHDWRYTMILPDGSLFGQTGGEGSARVAFCITCHEAVPEKHHQMFFVPQEYRLRSLAPE